MAISSFGGIPNAQAVKMRVYFEGSDTIYEGMPVCFNHDTTTNWLDVDSGDSAVFGANPTRDPYYDTTTAEGNQNEGKGIRVEKPSDDNIELFAGVVCGSSPNLGESGPGTIDIYVPNGAIVPVRTDVNCTAGDTKLYLEGGDYELGGIGDEVGNASRLVAVAMETVDRSSTAGICLARLEKPSIVEAYDISSASGRGPSEDLWQDCPLFEMMLDPGHGYYYFNDYMGEVDATTGDGWTITQATSGTLGSVIGVGGELHLSAGASTADQGVNCQLLNCCVKPTANKTIWFEARIQVSHVDNQIFVGLASTDTTLIASGALDETNPSSIGFFTDVNSTSGQMGCITQKAGSNETTEDVATLPATTWKKVGFRVNGVSSVQFYVDGALVETSSDTDDIPDAVELAYSLVCQNEDGANTNTLKVDWVRIAQLV